jgi:hypothetical protein
VLRGLRAGHYRIDFTPVRPTRARQYVWTLPRPAECDLTGRGRVRLILEAKRSTDVRVAIRSGRDAGVDGKGRRAFWYDVTAGHMRRLAEVRTDAEGRASLLAVPGRSYVLRTKLGTSALSRVVQSPAFTAAEYADRPFEWTLSGEPVAAWRIELVLRNGDNEAPFRQDAQLHIQGKGLSTTMGLDGGRRTLSVFKGGEEGMTYLVAGHHYELTLSDPTSRDFYIRGDAAFDVPRDIAGERTLTVVLGRKRDLRLECVDAATGRALPAFSMTFRELEEGRAAHQFRVPSGPHSLPHRVVPGSYDVEAAARGYQEEQMRIEIGAGTEPQRVRAVLSPLDLLSVTLDGPEDAWHHAHAWIDYLDRKGRVRPARVAEHTIIFQRDSRRPAALFIRPGLSEEYASQSILLRPDQKAVTVHLQPGVLFEAKVQVGGRPFSRQRPGGLVFVELGPPRLLAARGLPREDGIVASRLLPGKYAVYLIAAETGESVFHLGDVNVVRDMKRTYEFGSFADLEPRRASDPLRTPAP